VSYLSLEVPFVIITYQPLRQVADPTNVRTILTFLDEKAYVLGNVMCRLV
jgi:hypothetical protein